MTDEGSTRKDAAPQVDPDSTTVAADDEQAAPAGRNIGSWLLVPVAVVMVLLCWGQWAVVAFHLNGVFSGNLFHIRLNGFGDLGTDVADAPPVPGHASSLGGWLVCICAAVLLVAGVLRGLRRFAGPAGIAAVVAALAQIAVVIYSAVVVNSQSGGFYSKLASNAKASGITVTFSVGWGLWLELLLGFLALALAVGVLVRERNADVLRIRL
ncbi:hypothetical protein [Allobranchiibius huperziae]|uniref:Uncharacterized protein n=1 Tax=Allobranchiibius huperziae TaxID=1874116 RepID=A0A853D7M1_9MICO|nr:hypothetical protein [Allobranchiibius huperziae]NYJ73142.1 hypothetical protein [Allobranchiibius huperziae]